jgi:hypothetical protein
VPDPDGDFYPEPVVFDGMDEVEFDLNSRPVVKKEPAQLAGFAARHFGGTYHAGRSYGVARECGGRKSGMGACQPL